MPPIPRLVAAILAASLLSACARSVPARETPPSLATPTAAPQATSTPSPVGTPNGEPVTPTPQASNRVVGTLHVVQDGDTLFSLANQYGVSVQAIMEANGIADPDVQLQAGSTLLIPVETSTTEQTSATSGTAGEGASYTVQPGDTLATIAQRFGVTVEALVEANGLADPGLLSVGQVLTLPEGADASAGASTTGGASGGTQPSVPASVGTPYLVQPGDTLWSIAQAFGTTQAAIMAANDLESASQIYAGQTLTIPNQQNLGK